jgi:hypothetical protein
LCRVWWWHEYIRFVKLRIFAISKIGEEDWDKFVWLGDAFVYGSRICLSLNQTQ